MQRMHFRNRARKLLCQRVSFWYKEGVKRNLVTMRGQHDDHKETSTLKDDFFVLHIVLQRTINII